MRNVFIPLLGEDGRRPPINTDPLHYRQPSFLNKGNNALQSIDEYEKVCDLKEGEFGIIKVIDKALGEEHVLKKMQMTYNKQFPNNSMLEMRILSKLSHPSVITFEGMVAGHNWKENYIAMEYCEENLTQLLTSFTEPFDPPQLKCMMKFLLSGLEYIHDRSIIHRDLSPSNLLITAFGQLKIADFSKAVIWQGEQERMYNVGTPGYRALELVIGYKKYTSAIDMWSAGCIFAELLLHKPVFSDSQLVWHQLHDIMGLCGASDVDGTVPHYLLESPIYQDIENRVSSYEKRFSKAPPSAIELLKSFFKLDFANRIEASAVPSLAYFSKDPQACDPSVLQGYFFLKRKPGIRSEPMDQSSDLEEGEILNSTENS